MNRAMAEDNVSQRLSLSQSILTLRILNASCHKKTVSEEVDNVYAVLQITTFPKDLTARVVGNNMVTSGSEEVEVIIRSVAEILSKLSSKLEQGSDGLDEAVGRTGRLSEDRIKTVRKIIKRLKNRHFDNRNRSMNACLTSLTLDTEKLLSRVAVRDTFVKGPSDDTTGLWKKLDLFASSEELLQLCPYQACPVCCSSEGFRADQDFAVNNHCSHILCEDCAERIFNVNEKEIGRCPSCRGEVRGWTTNARFLKNKRKQPLKKKMLGLFNGKRNNSDTNPKLGGQ